MDYGRGQGSWQNASWKPENQWQKEGEHCKQWTQKNGWHSGDPWKSQGESGEDWQQSWGRQKGPQRWGKRGSEEQGTAKGGEQSRCDQDGQWPEQWRQWKQREPSKNSWYQGGITKQMRDKGWPEDDGAAESERWSSGDQDGKEDGFKQADSGEDGKKEGGDPSEGRHRSTLEQLPWLIAQMKRCSKCQEDRACLVHALLYLRQNRAEIATMECSKSSQGIASE